MKDIRNAQQAGRCLFRPASAVLHKDFPSGSFKTDEAEQKGNLQLSFDARNKKLFKVDADIDIYSGPLRHFFGEVFWNHLADMKTDPFQVHQILVKARIWPEYSLEGGA